MNRVRISRPPSPYPSFLFHLIRIVQLFCSTFVLIALSFFIHFLIEDSYYIPWTFIVLLSVSSFTNLSVIVTAYFYHYRSLRPRLSSLINTGLTALWAMGFGMLTWNLSGTLSHQCDIDNWSHETGIMVCRIYKAIETFTILGFLATSCSLLLDFHVLRKIGSRGTYDQMGDQLIGGGDRKRGLALHSREFSINALAEDRPAPFRSGARSRHGSGSGDDGADETLTRGYREPSIEFPEYSHEAKKPYKVQRQMDISQFGYAAPSEQTSYGGAASRTLDRQFGEDAA